MKGIKIPLTNYEVLQVSWEELHGINNMEELFEIMSTSYPPEMMPQWTVPSKIFVMHLGYEGKSGKWTFVGTPMGYIWIQKMMTTGRHTERPFLKY